MWFWLSIVTILFWSGSDVFSKMGSKENDKLSHWKMVFFVGLVMGIHAAVLLITGAEFKLADIITYLPASFFYILSMILGYVGLRYIMLSVSSPICNSSGALACVLLMIVLKEFPENPLQYVGLVLVCVGVVALAILEQKKDKEAREGLSEEEKKKYSKGFIAVMFPIFYCIIDALGTFVDGYLLGDYDGMPAKIEETAGLIAYELTFLLMAVIAFVYVAIIRHEKISFKGEKPKIVAAICETAGQVSYTYAIAANSVVAAPMISTYCVFSLIWARILLKEKLTKSQYLVLAIAVAGILILGYFDA